MQADGQTGKAAAQGSVLMRRIRARAAPVPVPTPLAAVASRTPERAIATAIGRAAERVHRLPLFFDRAEASRMTLAELPELLPERALLSVAQGPGGALGVVALCPGLLASVIEMQATGRVSARLSSGRRPTRTDGAICADFVNACLAELASELAGHDGFAGIAGFAYGSHVDDPRPLGLLLEDQPYMRIHAHLRAGDAGQRDCSLMVALPVAAPHRPGLAPPVTAQAAAPAEEPADLPPPPSSGLGTAVLEVPITHDAVLCRRMIPLGKLRALAAGDLLALPRGALDMAVLETALGQPVLRGRLGQAGGCHALRILPPGTPDNLGIGAADQHNTGDLAQASFAVPAPGLSPEPPMDDLDLPDAFRAVGRNGSAGVSPLQNVDERGMAG